MNHLKSMLLAALVMLTAACTQIDTGNVGVESTFGQVKEDSLPPGVYMTAFKTVHEISAKETAIDLKDMTPKTANNITVQDMDLTIYYKLNPSHAGKLFTRYAGDLYENKEIGAYILGSGIVTRAAREAVYKASTQFDAATFHNKRTEFAEVVRSNLTKELATDAGKGAFEVTNVIVRNLVVDKKLEESILQAAQVEFQVRQKREQLELEKVEAERKRVAAEGEARANTIIANSLTPTLIELRRIEMMSGFADKGTHTVLLPQGGSTPLVQVK